MYCVVKDFTALNLPFYFSLQSELIAARMMECLFQDMVDMEICLNSETLEGF